MLRKLIPLEGNLKKRKVAEVVDGLIMHFKNGTIDTTDTYIKRDLRRINELYKANKLPRNVMADLRKGGVPFETIFVEKVWLKRIKEVVDHFEHTGKLPKQKVSKDLYNLCLKEKKYLNQVHPFAAFIKNNKDAGRSYKKFRKVVGTLLLKDWDHRYLAVKKIAAKYGRVSLKNCDVNLIQWMQRQRILLQEKKLPKDKIKKLLTIKEINWDTRCPTRRPIRPPL
jgi:hypothetical protein